MLWSWDKQGEGWHKGQIRAPSSWRAARTAPNPSSLLTSRCFHCWVSSEGPILAIPERAERKEWSFYCEYFKGTDVSGRRYFDGVPLSKSWQQPPAESERFGGTKQSDRLLDSITESDVEAEQGVVAGRGGTPTLWVWRARAEEKTKLPGHVTAVLLGHLSGGRGTNLGKEKEFGEK